MRRLVFPVILGLGGAAILVALGLWQVQRLHWKEAVLAEIDNRIAADPVPLPEAPDPETDRFLPVAVEGAYLPGEALVLVSVKGLGPGYRVIAPFQTLDGRRILIDRGYIREDELGMPRREGEVALTGNLHWPDEVDSFTPSPDLEKGIWFARDVPALAEALQTDPVLVVLRTTSMVDATIMPMPVTSEGIPNDHLQYAVTWFGLAAVWLAMTALLIRRNLRREA